MLEPCAVKVARTVLREESAQLGAPTHPIQESESILIALILLIYFPLIYVILRKRPYATLLN